MKSEPLIDRFEAKVDRSPGHGPDGDCWVWTGARMVSGYGQIKKGAPSRKALGAPRAAILLEGADIPSGMSVLHHCDNPSCVNPDHLWIGTHRDNMIDMVNKGRHPRTSLPGERNGRAKLTSEQISEIRLRFSEEHPITMAKLARDYDVTTTTICSIVNGKTWTRGTR